MANSELVMGEMGSGIKAIFTATANTSYASQLNELVPYYLGLTLNVRMKSILKIDNAIYHIRTISDATGGYVQATNATNLGSSVITELRIRTTETTGLAVRMRLNAGTAGSVTITSTDFSTDIISGSIQLIVFY